MILYFCGLARKKNVCEILISTTSLEMIKKSFDRKAQDEILHVSIFPKKTLLFTGVSEKTQTNFIRIFGQNSHI